MLVDPDGDITIKENEFRGSEGFWELLTLKNVNKEQVTTDDLRKYKKILLLTNGHLEGYQREESLMSAEGKNSAKLSPRFSRGLKARESDQGYAVQGKNTKMSARAIYYDPQKPSAFSIVNKLTAAVPKKNKSDVRDWLEHQDAYTMHTPVRKRFLRDSYTVSNFMHLWECDLLDMQSLANNNDMYRYILSLIDVFSKYQHLVPVKTKTGPAITSAFRSLFHDDDSRRPAWVRTTRAKNF